MPHYRSISPGITAALAAALLFGAGTPLAKRLLDDVDPWLLAGLLYLGAGIALTLYRRLAQAPRVRLPPREIGWLAAAIISGGIIAPVMLMYGLSSMVAASASLLLNAESVFTALLAWFVFKENFDRRIAFGMLAIVAGAALLSWPAEIQASALAPPLVIMAACAAWALDNNFTRKLALADASWIAASKGMVAGTVNLAIALALGARWPSTADLGAALVIGAVAYGASLALFIVGLRHLGTARTSAYFSVAPFFGALLALAMGDPVTWRWLGAGMLMAIGVWLHLTEKHAHWHDHPVLDHEHSHTHDAHHQHPHEGVPLAGTHSHRHRHDPLTHSHSHYPDGHHQHDHKADSGSAEREEN